MFNVLKIISATLLLLTSSFSQSEVKTDPEIKAILIQQSIEEYSGSCPCPYNRARNGSKCGKRSAWSRPGGAEPLCFAKDISAEMISTWKQLNSSANEASSE